MKMLHFEQTSLNTAPSYKQILSKLQAFEKKIISFTSKAFTNFQINRLSSALNNMSDDQLTRIGLERKDIRKHAENLVKYEYDGL